MNRLLFGDNLKWLRDKKIFPDASVDLIYLDPPFNSNASYNVLFRRAKYAQAAIQQSSVGGHEKVGSCQKLGMKKYPKSVLADMLPPSGAKETKAILKRLPYRDESIRLCLHP